jgi:hypothetical protein
MRHFVLQFLAGCWHGRSLDSQSADHEEKILAQTLYFLVGDGAVGRKLNGLTPEAIRFATKRKWEPPEPARSDPAACDYTVIDRKGDLQKTVIVLKHGVKP